MNTRLKKHIERGERRIREFGRRIVPIPDSTTELVNLITESRDGWRSKAENLERQVDMLLAEKSRLEKLVHGQAILLKDADFKNKG